MLLVAAMFSAQMFDVGRYGLFDDLTGLFGKGFKEELKDPEDTYAREGMWFLFLWLKPEDVKLMGVAAAPLTLLRHLRASIPESINKGFGPIRQKAQWLKVWVLEYEYHTGRRNLFTG